MQCSVAVAHSEGEAQVPPVEKLTKFQLSVLNFYQQFLIKYFNIFKKKHILVT